MVTYHLANHHDIRPQVLVNREDVKNADIPEDDIQAVEDTTL